MVVLILFDFCGFISPIQHDAIFTLKCTTEQFTHCGSSVYAASLDIKKAFDTVNHYKLYHSLLSYGVPWIIVDVLLAGIVRCLL